MFYRQSNRTPARHTVRPKTKETAFMHKNRKATKLLLTNTKVDCSGICVL